MERNSKPFKQALREYLDAKRPDRIGEAEWRDLHAALGPVSDTYLLELLRNAAVPVDQPWAGVRQHTLEELEASLLELLDIFRQSNASADRSAARYCRRQVIAAKDRARFIAHNPKMTPARRALKVEMVEWMMVWLENPEVFPAWVEAKKSRTG